MKKYQLIFLLAIICTSFISCKKRKDVVKELQFDQYKLPIVTNSGDNYFGYLIDGEPVWGKKESILDSRVQVKYNEREKLLALFFDTGTRSVAIHLRSIVPTMGATYPLTSALTNPGFTSSATFYEEGPPITTTSGAVWGTFKIFDTNDQTLSYIKITNLNFQSRIITGEFELTVSEMGSTVNRQITKGRFDANFKVQGQ